MRAISILFAVCMLLSSSAVVFADEAKEAFKDIHRGAKKITRSVDRHAKKGFKKVHKQAKKDTRTIDRTAKRGWKEVGHDVKTATKAD